MFTKEVTMTLRLEDVENLSIEAASDWLDERDISYELLESHGEMLDLIRATLANADATQEQNQNVSRP